MIDQIDIGILTSGNKEFLARCVASLNLQKRQLRHVYIHNDSPTSVRKLLQKIIGDKFRYHLNESLKPNRLGQWESFRRCLKMMPKNICCGILHDDDILLPNYSKKMIHFLNKYKKDFVCTSAICEFNNNKSFSLLNNSLQQRKIFRTSSDLGEFYLSNFLPFPGSFFNCNRNLVLNELRDEFKEMSDAVLLIRLADQVPVMFMPWKIYGYYRHAGQVSHSMDHQMQDKFIDFIKNQIAKPKRKTVSKQIKKILTSRFFQTAWSVKTFRGHKYKVQIDLYEALKALRNRKIQFIKILFQDVVNIFMEKTYFKKAPKINDFKFSQNNPLLIIIFSKNRANQCEALLRSVKQRLRFSTTTIVLYKADSTLHKRAYDLAIKTHPETIWLYEKSFRTQVLNLLRKKYSYVMFCTDDGVFFRHVVNIPMPNTWDKTAGVSLRLGENCRYSHPADQHYPLPARKKTPDSMCWKVSKSKGDFRVTFSLDATIYPLQEIFNKLRVLSFKNPNTMEDSFGNSPNGNCNKWMISLIKSAYVSNPVNRVNSSHKNRFGLRVKYHPNHLARKYLQGWRIDLNKTFEKTPNGPHMEYPLKFEKFRT